MEHIPRPWGGPRWFLAERRVLLPVQICMMVVALTVNSRQQFQFSRVCCFHLVYVHYIFSFSDYLEISTALVIARVVVKFW